MSAERIAALDALGFVWEPNREGFAQGLAEFAQYVRTSGSGRISADYVAPSGFELGLWCGMRRTQRNDGRLSDDRIAQLDALDFVWDQLQEDFDAALAELAAYVQTHGTAKVPQDYETPDGFKLGDWCVERRKRRRQGKLPQDRIAALDELGFVWEPHKDIYDRGLAELRAYIEQNGDARMFPTAIEPQPGTTSQSGAALDAASARPVSSMPSRLQDSKHSGSRGTRAKRTTSEG